MTTDVWSTGWHAVVDYLVHAGVPTVFGLPADDLGLLSALDPTEIRLVLAQDQRNAVFMTTGYALASGGTGVCFVGKGPAVSNTLTGLLEARASAVPLVVLAAGTPAEHLGSGAFQELDQVALVRPLVKWAARIDHPDRLQPVLEKAFRLAAAGAPGPVYVELPDDLLTTEIPSTRPWAVAGSPARANDLSTADDALSAIRASTNPVILVGGGMRHRNDGALVERLADRLGAAVFCTASGRAAVDEDHPLFCGLAGLYSPAELGDLWTSADLVVSLGSRLEETARFGPGFVAPTTTIVQVNIDVTEFSGEFGGPLVVGDAADVVTRWTSSLESAGHRPAAGWMGSVQAGRAVVAARAAQDRKEAEASENIGVIELLSVLDELAPADRILVQENGLADMWSYFYPHWSCHRDGGSIVPSEQTSLGFGASAAAGVALGAPGRPVVALVGDGAFSMVGNDLITLVEQNIPVLYLVLSNNGYGWLQSQLDKIHPRPRFAFVAPTRCLGDSLPRGVHHVRVEHREALRPALTDALSILAAGRVAVLELPVDLADAALADSHGDGFATGGS